MYSLVGALALSLLVAGCWVDSTPPSGVKVGCNGAANGKCDGNETFQGCPQDCPACMANSVATADLVKDPANATGKPDAKFAELGPYSILVLVMGGSIHNRDSSDLEIKGSVVSSTGITVHVKDEDSPDSDWLTLGTWSGGSMPISTFNLQTVGLTKSDNYLIQLTGDQGSRARLDAVVAQSCP